MKRKRKGKRRDAVPGRCQAPFSSVALSTQQKQCLTPFWKGAVPGGGAAFFLGALREVFSDDVPVLLCLSSG